MLLRGLGARRAEFAFRRIQIARPLKPMVRASVNQVSAAARSLRASAPRNSSQVGAAETLARAGHRRIAGVGVDQRQ